MGTEFQVYKLKSILEIEGSDDCTTLRLCFTSPNCTL